MKFKNKEELSKAYDELEKAYTKECQENKKLREQLKLVESDQTKIWQPKEDYEYWIIETDGRVAETYNNNNSDCDKRIFECGNYFKSKEEAEKQAEYNRVMNRFRKYVEAYNKPLDWDDLNIHKWFVYWDPCNNTLGIDWCVTRREAFQIYASSWQIIKDAINYSAGSEKEFTRIVFGG